MLCLLPCTIDRGVVLSSDVLSPVFSLLQVPCASAPDARNRGKTGLDDSGFDYNTTQQACDLCAMLPTWNGVFFLVEIDFILATVAT